MGKWKAKFESPEKAVRVALNNAINFVLGDMEAWVKSRLIVALVYGGYGIQGIEQTSFYQFITSDEGLSQLGIEPSEPPKLLRAYMSSITIARRGSSLEVGFGDERILRLATRHPATGTGNLDIDSWLEWVQDGLTVGRGFVPRDRLPDTTRESIRLGEPLGGLMLPRGAFGSPGTWRFPTHLQNYENQWLSDNAERIEAAVLNQTRLFLSERMNG